MKIRAVRKEVPVNSSGRSVKCLALSPACWPARQFEAFIRGQIPGFPATLRTFERAEFIGIRPPMPPEKDFRIRSDFVRECVGIIVHARTTEHFAEAKITSEAGGGDAPIATLISPATRSMARAS